MDRRVLSPIQLAAITRIYGDHGAEILELLRKNPCKTIPIILARLRQKDLEWRVTRERLNKAWAQVQRSTYYKSLDRSSQDLKNEDKKCQTSKALLNDIAQKRSAQLAREEMPKPVEMPKPGSADAAGKFSNKGKGREIDAEDDDDSKGDPMEEDDMEEGGDRDGEAEAGDKGRVKDEDDDDGKTENGGAKRQTPYERKLAAYEAGVKRAKEALASRLKAEASPPHYMHPHIKLAYPPVDVRQDLHQFLLHAVRCSANSPGDKAKMLKVLPTLRAWMGGSLSWDLHTTVSSRVSKVYKPKPGAACGLSGLELGIGGAATWPAGGAQGYLSELRVGSLVLTRWGEARVTSVKKGLPPPTVAVGGGGPVVLAVEGTIICSGKTVSLPAKEILQLRPEGIPLAPPSPLNEDGDSSRPSSASSNSSLGSAGADIGNGMRGGGEEGGVAGGDGGLRLPETERLFMCTQ
ncbi:unnamed protein product, partial [Sphacelaria rigidula]